MTLDVVQFVDSISASPTVRLNLNNENPWAVTGADFSPPALKQAWASTLLVDGERLTAAAYANRTLTLTLELIGTQDASASALQALWRELNRPTNLLRYQPDGATSPVFFRTLRSMDNSVRDYHGGGGTALRTLQVEIEAEPFALGLRRTLPTVTVYNDPAEGAVAAVPSSDTDGVVVSDAFTRTAASWGTADSGQAWTTSGGSASDYSTDGAAGLHSIGSVNVSRRTVLDVSLANVDMVASIVVPVLAVGAPINAGHMARHGDANNYYLAEVQLNTDQSVQVRLRKNVAGTLTTLVTSAAVAGLTHTVGRVFRLRMMVRSSTLRARVWDSALAEPAVWHAETTDTSFTAAGQVGARSVLAVGNTNTPPVVVSYDSLTVIEPPTVGMCFDVTSPKGDVEAPLFLSVRASDVARVPESGGTGRRQSVIAVRRGGTPSAMPAVLQAESMLTGTDTTVQAASGSSGTFLRVSFATATSLQQRATSVGQFPSAAGVDARGTYRVFLRCRKSVAGDSMQLQMRYANAGTSVTSDLVAGPADAVWRWVDMGLVQMPLGYDPATDGLSGVSLPVGGMGVRLDAARTSGSGTLDLDVIVFLPADDRLSLVKWPDSFTETAYVVDAAAGQAYGVGASGEVRAALLEMIGGAPMVTPGVANRIWMLRDVGSTWSEGDDVTGSVQVTPYYWPRYLHMRPVAS